MNAQKIQSLQSLLAKLSAMRVALNDEEQQLLDVLIQGTQFEFDADEVKAVIKRAYGADQIKINDADETNAMLAKIT